MILSPIAVRLRAMVPTGSSITLRAFATTLEMRQGKRFSCTQTTARARSRKTTSMANRIPKVWTPRDGIIHKPRSSRVHCGFCESRPMRREKCVSATETLVASSVCRVELWSESFKLPPAGAAESAKGLGRTSMPSLAPLFGFTPAATPNDDGRDKNRSDTGRRANQSRSIHLLLLFCSLCFAENRRPEISRRY